MTSKELYKIWGRNGLKSSKNDEPYFTWRKCDNCNGLAGNRYEVEGYISLEEARQGEDNLYTLELCEECFYELMS